MQGAWEAAFDDFFIRLLPWQSTYSGKGNGREALHRIPGTYASTVTVTESQIAPRLKLKLLPILVTAVLGYGLPYTAGYGAFFCSKIFHTPSPYGPTLPWLYSQHALQCLLALIVIAVLKFKRVPADYGLHWPRGKTYIGSAILWGIGFGVLMTIVDYVPQLLAHIKPIPGFPHTPSNIAHRPLQHELGGHYCRTDLRAVTREQFRYTQLAGSIGPAVLRLRTWRSLCLLAGKIEERCRTDHRP
jgi:hypothetical protein